jgi:hypothetical protein
MQSQRGRGPGLFFKKGIRSEVRIFYQRILLPLTDTFIHDSGENIGRLGMHAVYRSTCHLSYIYI